MNDNQQPWSARPVPRHAGQARDAASLQDLEEIATRAVVKPESLTMGEIQEIGWRVLVASRNLSKSELQPVRGR